MNTRRLLASAAGVFLLGAHGATPAAQWHAVPGAPDVQVDLASVQSRSRTVDAWIRGLPARVVVQRVQAGGGAAPPRVHRTLLRLQFDCGARSVRSLAVLGYSAAGAPVYASDVPSAPAPAGGDHELQAVYDAVCELGRAAP